MTTHGDSTMSMPHGSGATAPTPTETSGPADRPVSVTVHIEDFAFATPDIRVAVGGAGDVDQR